MNIKCIFIFLADLIFPILQNGPPGPGPGQGRVPITEAILLLVVAAFGLGIKTFSRKRKN